MCAQDSKPDSNLSKVNSEEEGKDAVVNDLENDAAMQQLNDTSESQTSNQTCQPPHDELEISSTQICKEQIAEILSNLGTKVEGRVISGGSDTEATAEIKFEFETE